MNIATPVLNLEELAKRVHFNLDKNTPVVLVGSPGIGKTEWGKSITKDRNADYEAMVLSTMEPTEIIGFPSKSANGKEAEFLPYGLLKKMFAAKKELIIHMQDFIQGADIIQKQCMTLIRERHIKGRKVPDCVKFLIDTNDASHGAGGGKIIEPVKSRTAIFQFPVDWKRWIKWGIESTRIDPRIAFYIRSFPDSLNNFEPSRDIKNYPCPRTWEMASDYVKGGFDDFPTLASVLGDSEASKCAGFLQDFKTLGGLWGKIEKNPDDAPLMDTLERIYALGIIIANNLSKKNVDKVVKYLKRYKNDEVLIFILETGCMMHPDVKETKEYIQYVTKSN